MFRLLVATLLFVAFALSTIAQQTPQAPPPEKPATIQQPEVGKEPAGWADVVAHARPAVVVIETDRGLGSGFVVKSDGTIVTNHHVVADATSMAVKFASGEIYRNVYLLGSDPVEDLAFSQD